MEPVLLSKDTKKIQHAVDYVNHMIPKLQAVYDEASNLGIVLDLDELFTLLNSGFGYIKNKVAEKTLDQVGTPSFNGVRINRAKLLEIIDLLDMRNMQTALNNYFETDNPLKIMNRRFFTITEGAVKLDAEAETSIDAMYTKYTSTERGHEIAAKLVEIIKVLNEYRQIANKLLVCR